MAKDILAILGVGPKGKGPASSPDEEEAPESKPDVGGPEEASEYKSVFVDAAKAGDWDAAFDALEACLRK